MTDIDQYLRLHGERFEAELCDLLRIASVSAQPECRAEILRAADWLDARFRRLGFRSEIVATEGCPLVVAESPHVEGAPTALVYGHYDVQPADPLDRWTSPPFEPTRRGGNLYARGATDDKGQMLTHLLSAEAWVECRGALPLNLKYVIEGEEEVGSRSLETYLAGQADRLATDCIVISDGAQFAPGIPAICYGLRGIAYYELRVAGPNRDLHSGSFGGSVTNPAGALAKVLAGMTDNQGRVTIPGFYDDVAPLSDQERRLLAELPFDETEYLLQLGVTGTWGEEGYTLLERRWARPAYDVCGLWSGYQGEGAKTILPATAHAKFSFRLVPNQDPHKITQGIKWLLTELCPPGIELELVDLHGSPGLLVSLESPYVDAAARAIEQAFGRRPVLTREGGSIPIVATLHETLRADVLLLGWGQNDDNTPAPDEKLSLADFHRGIRASARLWQELAHVP